MSDHNSLVSLGDLSKPATTLIQKISNAVGGVFKPYQIIRVAKAEAEADLIRAEAEIKVTDLHRRAMHRFLNEEAKKQENIEEITRKALPQLAEDGSPEKLDDDWITNFFDKCRLSSDDQMQELWSRVLAGEANNPGTFARRTVNLVSSLDKRDAEQFTALCSFCWMVGPLTPLVYDVQNDIYKKRGITFETLTHLDSIGLLRFEATAEFTRTGLPKKFPAFYYSKPLALELPKDVDNSILIGKVLLTKMGIELAPICGSRGDDEIYQYIQTKWKTLNYLPVSSAPAAAPVADPESNQGSSPPGG